MELLQVSLNWSVSNQALAEPLQVLIYVDLYNRKRVKQRITVMESTRNEVIHHDLHAKIPSSGHF